MVSRLPITIRPAHQEIALSYFTRLAALHDLPIEDLWQQVSLPKSKGNATRRLDAGLLATVANQPQHRLQRAIIELFDDHTDWLALRHEPQPGCWRCDARHRGGPVLHLFAHHTYVCTRHRIWIGPPDQHDHPQPSLDALPEVVTAQHRHLRLLRRLGPAATYDAVLTGFLFCVHSWNFTQIAAPEDAWLKWIRRAEVLIPRGTESDTFSTSRLFAVTYPEAVTIAGLVGPLHWRRLAAGGPDEQRRFTDEIAHRLGLRDYYPTMSQDPIAHWIEQDCWAATQPAQHRLWQPADLRRQDFSQARQGRREQAGARGLLVHAEVPARRRRAAAPPQPQTRRDPRLVNQDGAVHRRAHRQR